MQEEKSHEAREVAEHILAATWPERFGDVKRQARSILRRVRE